MLRRPRRLLTVLAALALAALAGGCDQGGASAAGPPRVVAAESAWGSIAAQLGGARAATHSIITNPAQDPHNYDPTAADARSLALGRLVIVNGIDYDPWARRLLAADPDPRRIVLDVGALLHVRAGGNPHRWYDPSAVATVARAIVRDLERLDPGARAGYSARLRAFERRSLAAYHRWIAAIRRRYAGVGVGASESIFALQAPALGLRLLTPARLMNAVSEGTDVDVRDLTQVRRQITARQIRAWVFNAQNATPTVTALNALARRHGIPVVSITETLTPASATFQTWQVGQLRALAAALHEATAR